MFSFTSGFTTVFEKREVNKSSTGIFRATMTRTKGKYIIAGIAEFSAENKIMEQEMKMLLILE